MIDQLLHPALLDPRQWADIDLYGTAFAPERTPLTGTRHETPELPFRMQHLRLELRFDEERRRIAGTATWTLAPTSDGLERIELDAAEMEFSAVRLVSPQSGPLTWETVSEKLVIRLDRACRRDEVLTIEIAYSASPRKGLFFIAPDKDYPAKPLQIWSQGENEDAHWWFPCHDVTNQKMTTELLATARADLHVVSNGELLTVRENGDATRTWHWRLDQPHPAYLVSVVIGDYAVIGDNCDGLPLEYLVYRDRLDEGRRLFGQTPQMIRFLSAKFGVAFPYPKYSQVVVDDFIFGAMENTSATTMSDRCLLDPRASLDIGYEDIVAHELAHQWWGDLVTCRDWSQIWLNESFATYAEYLWREHREGRNNARWVLFQDTLSYLREDLTSHRRPVECRQYRFSEDLMDRHAYEKGACILDMLRDLLGDEPFFRALGHYLRKHAHGAAETHDFRIAVEEATGRSLGWFFEQWILAAGYPELEVTDEWVAEDRMLRLSVRQVQAEEPGGTVFRLPVTIEAIVPDPEGLLEVEQRLSFHVTLDRARQEFCLPCDARPVMVLFDKGHRLLKLMRYEKSAQELTVILGRASDLLDRVRAARELSVFRTAETVGTLGGVLRATEHSAVRMAAAISLGEIGGDEARAVLTDVGRSSADPRVRRTCLFALGIPRDQRDLPALREALENEPSYFAAVGAIRAIAHIGGDEAFAILSAAIGRQSWQEVVAASVFHGFNHAKERRAIDLALEHSRRGHPLPIRLAAIPCLGTLGKEASAEPLSLTILNHLTPFLDDPHPRVRAAATRAIAKLGKHEALDLLRPRASRECLELVKTALFEAIDKLK